MLNFQTWKVASILGACLLSIVFAFPSFLPASTVAAWPDFLPKRQISLGLDLRGGSHILLEVNYGATIRDRLSGIVDTLRGRLRDARIGYVGLSSDAERVTFTLREPERVDEVRKIVREADADLEMQVVADGRVELRYGEKALDARRRQAVDQSIEIVRRRVDETGTKEPTIQRQGEDRILLQLPGIEDPESVKRLLGRTAKLSFQMVDLTVAPEDARSGRLPPGSEILPADTDRPGQPSAYVVRKRVIVSGENLKDAQPTLEQREGVWAVSFAFDAAGGRRFGEATSDPANIGKPFAIVLDGKVISAPAIREPITGGRGIITGSFNAQSATDLALLLRAGALPAPLTILEERTVGPDLGADSIRAGELAIALGFALVCVLMVVYYGLFGIFANLALVLNLIITLAVMSLLQATLTLPGLAGMVLGLALAVDANVLIYERMREEAKLGRGAASAADAAFRRAFITILDSNLTTFIAAVLLYALGSGPVRGFAVTLAIGISASMFTAVLVTRMLVAFYIRSARPKALPL